MWRATAGSSNPSVGRPSASSLRHPPAQQVDAKLRHARPQAFDRARGVVPGAGRAGQLREPRDGRRVVPRGDGLERVRAQDEHEADAVGHLAAQLDERVGGVGDARPLDFARARRAPGAARDRQFDHAQAVGRGGRGEPDLERRHAGGDVEDPVEPQLRRRGVRKGGVAPVDGVERAPHDPERRRAPGPEAARDICKQFVLGHGGVLSASVPTRGTGTSSSPATPPPWGRARGASGC